MTVALVASLVVGVFVLTLVAREFRASADATLPVQQGLPTAAASGTPSPTRSAASGSLSASIRRAAPPSSAGDTVRGNTLRATTVRATLPRMVVKPGHHFALKPVPVTLTTSFRIGTLNVLGSQHTAGAGGFGSGTSRAAREAGLIGSRGLDLVGLQEVQPDQLRTFVGALPSYTVWPQQTLGPNAYRLQLAFRSDRFELVEGDSVTYLFDSKHIPMPYALLRDRDSGAEFWVIVTHNSPGGMQREREVSTAIESQLMAQLAADGHPVILLGDLNEHLGVICRLGHSTPVVTANGASSSGGSCRGPFSPLRIDWIVSTPGPDFTGYVQDATPRATGMSDHYLIAATTSLSYTTLRKPASRNR